jgi:hypothetical protein
LPPGCSGLLKSRKHGLDRRRRLSGGRHDLPQLRGPLDLQDQDAPVIDPGYGSPAERLSAWPALDSPQRPKCTGGLTGPTPRAQLPAVDHRQPGLFLWARTYCGQAPKMPSAPEGPTLRPYDPNGSRHRGNSMPGRYHPEVVPVNHRDPNAGDEPGGHANSGEGEGPQANRARNIVPRARRLALARTRLARRRSTGSVRRRSIGVQ